VSAISTFNSFLSFNPSDVKEGSEKKHFRKGAKVNILALRGGTKRRTEKRTDDINYNAIYP